MMDLRGSMHPYQLVPTTINNDDDVDAVNNDDDEVAFLLAGGSFIT